MCWSLCFVAVLEETQERIGKIGELKHHVAVNVNAQSRADDELSPSDPEKGKVGNDRMSFERYWSSNKWIAVAFHDAKDFTATRTPRDTMSVLLGKNGGNTVPGLRSKFNEILLPALRNRGWTECTPHPNSKKKACYRSPQGIEVRCNCLLGHPLKVKF
jgi:hypothetical protein